MSHKIDVTDLEQHEVRHQYAASFSPSSHKTLDIIFTPEGREYEVFNNRICVLRTKYAYLAVKEYNSLP